MRRKRSKTIEKRQRRKMRSLGSTPARAPLLRLHQHQRASSKPQPRRQEAKGKVKQKAANLPAQLVKWQAAYLPAQLVKWQAAYLPAQLVKWLVAVLALISTRNCLGKLLEGRS